MKQDRKAAVSSTCPTPCSGASVDERLDALHSLTRRALAERTDGGLFAATAYHLAARRLRQNVTLEPRRWSAAEPA